MPTPQTGFAPQSFQVGPEAEFIKRPNVDKVSVFACDFVRVLVFLDRLVAAGPLTDSADGLLVNTLEDILSREARADDGQHELLTGACRWPRSLSYAKLPCTLTAKRNSTVRFRH